MAHFPYEGRILHERSYKSVKVNNGRGDVKCCSARVYSYRSSSFQFFIFSSFVLSNVLYKWIVLPKHCTAVLTYVYSHTLFAFQHTFKSRSGSRISLIFPSLNTTLIPLAWLDCNFNLHISTEIVSKQYHNSSHSGFESYVHLGFLVKVHSFKLSIVITK